MLQRRVGSGLAVVIAAAVAAGASSCGGPIDSRPSPPRDSGTDSGAGGERIIDPVHDAAVDAALDVGWPTVPGCVSGVPPSPHFSPDSLPPVTLGCASSSSVLMRVSDAAAQGMVFTAWLSPPIDGLSLDFVPDLCASDVDTPIQLFVRQLALRPGISLGTYLWISPVGPGPQQGSVFPLEIRTAAVDFTADPAVVDFGTVPAGVYQRMPITITNALDGALFDGVFSTEQQQGPFLLLPTPAMGAPSLQPGESRQMFAAVLNTQATGTFDATFLVSAFPPGTAVDPSCGVIRSITMHAQVVSAGPPPP